jgi:hypothetical protein
VSVYQFCYPRQWNQEEDIVLALTVRPIPSVHPIFRFCTSSLQLLAGIQGNFIGTINTRRRFYLYTIPNSTNKLILYDAISPYMRLILKNKLAIDHIVATEQCLFWSNPSIQSYGP